VNPDGLLQSACFRHCYLAAGRSHTSVRDAVKYVAPQSNEVAVRVSSLRFIFSPSFFDAQVHVLTCAMSLNVSPQAQLAVACPAYIGIRLHSFKNNEMSYTSTSEAHVQPPSSSGLWSFVHFWTHRILGKGDISLNVGGRAEASSVLEAQVKLESQVGLYTRSARTTVTSHPSCTKVLHEYG